MSWKLLEFLPRSVIEDSPQTFARLSFVSGPNYSTLGGLRCNMRAIIRSQTQRRTLLAKYTHAIRDCSGRDVGTYLEGLNTEDVATRMIEDEWYTKGDRAR